MHGKSVSSRRLFEDSVCDLAYVAADDVRTLAERAEDHAGPRNERCLATGGQRPGHVPRVRRDQSHLGERDFERPGDELVGLAPRLERAHLVGGKDRMEARFEAGVAKLLLRYV